MTLVVMVIGGVLVISNPINSPLGGIGIILLILVCGNLWLRGPP